MLMSIQDVIAKELARVAIARLENGLCDSAREPEKLTSVLTEVTTEVLTAETIWLPLNSAHEAYAVILEELDELWAHVKIHQGGRDLAAMRLEAVQVAATAIRFIRDICDRDRGTK